jgi:hypothetical protein
MSPFRGLWDDPRVESMRWLAGAVLIPVFLGGLWDPGLAPYLVLEPIPSYNPCLFGGAGDVMSAITHHHRLQRS